MPKKPVVSKDALLAVEAKLKRANECIGNLNSEIDVFLKKPEGGFGQYGEEAFHKFHEYARAKGTPPKRFSVLAGEVVHHLRSIFDHLIWDISDESFRRSNEARIGFPVVKRKPGNKKEISSYEGKIEGITSKRARKLIEELQPYNAPNALDFPLLILHNLNRIDKHQTIVLVECQWSATLSIPLRLFKWTVIGRPDIDPKLFEPAPTDKVNSNLSINIAFAEFGQRKNQPVIPSLTQLSNFTADVMGQFSTL